jgi:Novel toxin 15
LPRDKAALAEALVDQGYSRDEISDALSNVNATHYLDMIAGGDPSAAGIGGGAENRAIGSVWNQTGEGSMSRADVLANEANAMRDAGLHDQNMYVSLRPCE